MAIAVDIPRKRIAVSRQLDRKGGTAVYSYIKRFLIEQVRAGFDWPLEYPWPIRVVISAAQVGPDIWTHTYFTGINGWKIESEWNLIME